MCNIDRDKYCYITRSLGPTFTLSTSFVVGRIFPVTVDCGSQLSSSLASTIKQNRNQGLSQSSLSKQAQMFISMIEDILDATPSEIGSLLPSLHALQQCLRSGWQPDTLPEVINKLYYT